MKRKIKDICEIEKGNTQIQKAQKGDYPLVVTAENRLTSNTYQFDRPCVCIPLVSSTGHGHASIKRIHFQDGKFALGNILCALYSKDENIVLTKYLFIYLSFYKDNILVPLMKGSANVSLNIKDILNICIDFPNIDIQRKIVDKYESVIENKIAYLSKVRKDYFDKCYLIRKVLIDKYIKNSEFINMKDLFNIEKGSLQSSKCLPGKYNFITAAEDWKTNITYDRECEALIYAVGAEGSLGRTHYVNGKFIASDLCFILTSKIDCNYKLYKEIFYVYKNRMVSDLATGTSKKAINIKNFSNYLVPYSNIDIQNDLFSMIERINEIENKMNHIQEIEYKIKKSYIKEILEGVL